jgi:hypothetical protein
MVDTGLSVWINKRHDVLESEIHNENNQRDEYGSSNYYNRAVDKF